MKTNLSNFPEYNGVQSIELYLEQLRNWKDAFEKELREAIERNDRELKQLEELYSDASIHKTHFIKGWQFALKELLGE